MAESIREQLIDFMEQSGKSQNQISKEAGLSTSTLSQYIKGIYTGDNKKVSAQLENYLKVAKDRQNSQIVNQMYLDAQNTKSVIFGAGFTHAKGKIGIIYGDSGAGKTEALKHYAKTNAGVIMITGNASTKSTKSVLSMLCTQMGIHESGTETDLMNQVLSKLENTHKLIIVDEADHLTLPALQALRNLYDEAGVRIVLAGNNKIIYQMYEKKNAKIAKFEQFRTRIGIKIKVLNKRFNQKELNHIFPNMDSECQKYLLDVARSESLRVAINVAEYASLLAEGSGKAIGVTDLQYAYQTAFEVL